MESAKQMHGQSSSTPEDSGTKWDELTGGDRAVAYTVFSIAAVGLLHAAFGLKNIAALLNEPGAAGWVQAIGSIVALMIAIWVPKNIYQVEANERKEREKARAYIASIEVMHKTLPHLMHILTLRRQCETFQQEWSRGKRYDMDLDFLRKTLAALPLPTENQMQDLIGAGHSIARDAARGVSFIVQINAYLISVDNVRLGADEVAGVKLLNMFSVHAITHLERAHEAMNTYLRLQDERFSK